MAGYFFGGAVSEAGNGDEHAEQRRDSLRNLLPQKFIEGAAFRGGQRYVQGILSETQRAASHHGKNCGGKGCERRGSAACVEEKRRRQRRGRAEDYRYGGDWAGAAR